MTDKRKPGLSLLDYLWTNYGNLETSNLPNKIPSDETLLTETAIVSLLEDLGVTIEAKEIDGILHLYLKNKKGEILGDVVLDKFSNIIRFEKCIATEEDVIQGISLKVGDLGLFLEDDSGHSWKVFLPSYSGSETDSIITSVKDYKIASLIKIDNPIVDKSVDLKTTSNGLRAEIVIDETLDNVITIEKNDNGLSCHYKWIDESYEIKFKALKLSEYNIISEPDFGTLYFIVDLPCIFFRKIKFASPHPLEDYVKHAELEEAKDNLINYTDSQFIWGLYA